MQLMTLIVGPRHRVTANKEIILCAGTFGSPQLLLLSGIGPKPTLISRGIPSLVDLPSVGQNLTDHVAVANYFLVNSNATFDAILRNSTLLGEDLQEYLREGEGLLVDSPANTQGFARLPSNSPILQQFEDPSAGPLSAHMEYIFIVCVFFVEFEQSLYLRPSPPAGWIWLVWTIDTTI